MKVLIAGTPLESLVWQRAIKRVRILFRGGTDETTRLQFLNDLIETACMERLMIKHRMDERKGRNDHR